MKGSPVLRAILLASLMLALGWPLHLLTQKGEDAHEQASAQPTESRVAERLPLVLTFSKPAERVEIRHLGVVVWSKDQPALQEAVELNLPFPKEGAELGVSVVWGDSAASALRIQLTTPDGSELERTVWGTASTESIVPFP